MSKVKLNEKVNWGNNIIASINEMDKKGLIVFEKIDNFMGRIAYFATLKETIGKDIQICKEISEIAYYSKVNKKQIVDLFK